MALIFEDATVEVIMYKISYNKGTRGEKNAVKALYINRSLNFVMEDTEFVLI